MSKASSPQRQTVDWNPELKLWIQTPEQEGFFELSVPFSETWPPSGSMRNGRAWQLRRSALPTPGSESSSLPGRLLSTPVASDGGTDRGSSAGWGLRDEARKLFKTPTSNLGINGGSQHPDKRKQGGHGPTLADEVEHLLPTPRARDFKGCDPNPRGVDLNEAIRLLPTPVVADARDTANFRPDGTPYGEGYGMTLTDATRLFPTPRASDGEKGGPNQRGSKGDLMLPSAAAQLLPTPTRADGERTSSSYGRGNPTLTGAITDPPSAAGNTSSDDPHPGQPMLWDD